MKQIPLADLKQLTDFSSTVNKPRLNGVLLFKHSTRCIISKMALRELEKDWHYSYDELPVFLIDVLRNREISSQIADIYNVRHESPQILLLKDGVCVGNASHGDVSILTVDHWLNG
jgi:bacillithiol system protein YtxJ